jgi:hypothetical protein
VEHETFWRWQERMLGGLLAWGAANTVAGAGMARSRSIAVRRAGQQACIWGLIDLVLAVNGRRGARRQAITADATATSAAAARFRMILAVNGLLDIGYVAGGAGLAIRAARRPDQRGTGLGIALQGLFLLVYDSVLLRGTASWLRQCH